jgi:hypothetical protein
MFVMKSFVKEREKELKVTPNSKVDNLFNEVKTFFFEINKLSHYIEEFDFRGVLNNRLPRPFRAKNIKSVFVEQRTSDGVALKNYFFEDEASLRKTLRSFIEEVTENEKNVNECIADEIMHIIKDNCSSTEDYEQFRNHVKSFFYFRKNTKV